MAPERKGRRVWTIRFRSKKRKGDEKKQRENNVMKIQGKNT